MAQPDRDFQPGQPTQGRVRNDGVFEISVPVRSADGVEGTATLSITSDMKLRVVWEGAELTDFEAWSRATS